MEHHFNTELATRYGLTEAILLHNLFFWTEKNRADGRNYHDGRYWTYSSITAMKQLFPYLSERQINYALDKLEAAGAIYKGNYNEKKYDRTCWYAVDDKVRVVYLPASAAEPAATERPGTTTPPAEQPREAEMPQEQNCEIHFTNLSNGLDKIVKPIPDTNTDSNTDTIVLPAGAKPPDPIADTKAKIREIDKALKKAERESKKKDKRGGVVPFWQACVDTWDTTYRELCKTAPVITPAEIGSLRQIVTVLMKRAADQGVPWSEEQARVRLSKFFRMAYEKDAWMKANLSLKNCYSQINSILQIVAHGKQPTQPARPSNGRAAGAINYASRLLSGANNQGAGDIPGEV